MTDNRSQSAGAFAALAAYGMWGLFPAFFPLLAPARATEIVAHRIIWSLVVLVLVLMVTKRLAALRRLALQDWLRLGLAAGFVSINWSVYVFTVNSDRVSEAALGYFINPLVSVLFGMVLFGERLLRAQFLAVGLAIAAVTVLTVGYGHVPWLSLALATSFGLYGVTKKTVQQSADLALTAEVMVVTPFALGFVLWLHAHGQGNFGQHGAGHAALLAISGAVTVAPLLAFGFAAQRIQLSLLGMLQYITPTLQMIWALVVVHEHLDRTQWIGFALVLTAVVIFSGSRFYTDLRVQKRTAVANQ